MVVLKELAIGLDALLLGEAKRPLAALSLRALVPEVLEIGVEAVRPTAVGPAGQLHLQDAEVDVHLEHLPSVLRVDQAGLDDGGLEVPAAQCAVSMS